ncbi:MAG: hypothetical protein R2697_02215 [Ilumatobacteraceae bacterium]
MFLTPNEFDTFVADVTTDERIGVDGVSLVVIEGDEPPTQSPGSLPIVVAWVADVLGGDGPVAADVVVGPGDVDRVAELVATNPLAATSLATLLRGRPQHRSTRRWRSSRRTTRCCRPAPSSRRGARRVRRR